MRGFIVVLVIVLLMIVGGWLVFDIGESSSSVELRTDRIQEDTAEVVDRVRKATPDIDIEVNRNDVDDSTVE